jgi:hypothetical protein
MPGYALSEYEYSVTVPKMFMEPSSEPEIVIAISARGGGTVGKSYEQNHWDLARSSWCATDTGGQWSSTR